MNEWLWSLNSLAKMYLKQKSCPDPVVTSWEPPCQTQGIAILSFWPTLMLHFSWMNLFTYEQLWGLNTWAKMCLKKKSFPDPLVVYQVPPPLQERIM